MSRLDPGHPRLAVNTPNPERVSVPWASLSPIALVHLLMAPPLLLPYTAWHMMRTKADAMGITQWVTPLMEWLRAASVDPQQGISVVEAGDKKNPCPPTPPPPPRTPSQGLPFQQPFQMPATPSLLLAPAKQAMPFV